MNISFPLISSPRSVFAKNRVRNIPYFQGVKSCLTSDVFQKSANPVSFKGLNATESVNSNSWDDKTTEKIFNRAYKKVVEKTPILSELNIAKPELKFCKDRPDYLAGYDFKSNSLCVFPHINEPQYLLAFVDNDGKFSKPLLVATQTQVREFKEQGGFENYKNLRAIMLTQEEKEAYMEAGIAHELRHWTQTHLAASTEGSADTYLTAFRDMKRNFSELLKDAKAFGEEGADIVAQLEDSLKEMEYGATYKPKKLLNKNTKLKMSLHPKDTRYFSVNEHYMKGFLAMKEDLASEAYKALPHEADAFNYQFEYFDNLRQETSGPNVRKNVMNLIAMCLYEDAYGGIMRMPEYGFTPVIFE